MCNEWDWIPEKSISMERASMMSLLCFVLFYIVSFISSWSARTVRIFCMKHVYVRYVCMYVCTYIRYILAVTCTVHVCTQPNRIQWRMHIHTYIHTLHQEEEEAKVSKQPACLTDLSFFPSLPCRLAFVSRTCFCAHIYLLRKRDTTLRS